MEPEKTLLQQIREKEQEYAKKTEAARKETEAAVAAAENDAESLLCTADSAGKTEAEQLYWQEKGRTESEIGGLKEAALSARKAAMEKGERNLSRAVDTIIRSVTME
jgi:Vacuolar (H+)-ATPase G subunit